MPSLVIQDVDVEGIGLSNILSYDDEDYNFKTKFKHIIDNPKFKLKEDRDMDETI